MPPPYIELTLFNMKHKGDFPNTFDAMKLLHLEVAKEITTANKTKIMNTSGCIGLGITKELDTADRIQSLLDKVKAWSITASEEVVFSHSNKLLNRT